MITKKDRRHSGRITPKIIKPQMKYSEIKEKALEPNEVYDDWENYRDGFRDKKYLEWKKRDKKKDKFTTN